MSIELRCESCGKGLRAPRDKAGTRSKCPACGHELYIPTPPDELEELPFAPESNEDVAREEALLKESRDLDRALANEEGVEEFTEPPGTERAAGRPRGASRTEIYENILKFLLAMKDSALDDADTAIKPLKRNRAQTLAIVDELATDQLPPPAMADVPPGVYQGFLRSLRSQL